MKLKQNRTKILGTGRFLPEDELSNYDLEKIVDTSHEWIITRTGIESRRIADEKTATSDLATMAAKKALKKAGIQPEEIDMIIVGTCTPDMNFPATACIVQKNIGAVNAAAFDLETACSSFLYGLSIADQFIASGTYRYVLVIGAETMTKIIDWSDRNTSVLFGDGAGAAVLGPSFDDSGILSTTLGSNGSGGSVLTVPAGGSRMPASRETVDKNLHSIHMEGNEVFKFAVRIMDKAVKESLSMASLRTEDIDFLVPHQANKRIILAAAKKLKLDQTKIMINLNKYANTSAASIPIALDEAIEESRIKKGDIVVLVAFGAGLTWGASAIKW